MPHVIHVVLSREPVNSFVPEFWEEYGRLFDRLAEEGDDVRAVVVSSAYDKLFTAGLDLNAAASVLDPEKSTDGARSSLAMRKMVLAFQRSIGAPERCPFPVIVAIHGVCFGLGVDIITACDIRYAASNSSFSIKEVDVGLAADIGSLSFLPKISGNHSLIRELAYTARSFSAAEADKAGLLSKVVQGGREEVLAAALELAKVIASKSPIAVTGTKHLITHSRDHSVPENLEYTATWNAAALMTDDIPASLAAFKTKRAPKFAPLRPKL